jgi:hypothetical protein
MLETIYALLAGAKNGRVSISDKVSHANRYDQGGARHRNRRIDMSRSIRSSRLDNLSLGSYILFRRFSTSSGNSTKDYRTRYRGPPPVCSVEPGTPDDVAAIVNSAFLLIRFVVLLTFRPIQLQQISRAPVSFAMKDGGYATN